MVAAIPFTRGRVQFRTAEEIDQWNRQDMDDRIRYYSEHLDQIDERLAELDREWDVGRAMEVHGASLTLAGVVLSATVSRWFLILPVVAAGFLLEHAIQGWSPPVAGMRRVGFRTRDEIALERDRLREILDSQQRTVRGEDL